VAFRSAIQKTPDFENMNEWWKHEESYLVHRYDPVSESWEAKTEVLAQRHDATPPCGLR